MVNLGPVSHNFCSHVSGLVDDGEFPQRVKEINMTVVDMLQCLKHSQMYMYAWEIVFAIHIKNTEVPFRTKGAIY